MEDPGPSSAAPDPPSSPPQAPAPQEEGDGWVLLPAGEVEGIHAPKVIHWDDLQQELARLWSLSAALQAARDRKAQLAARLESALEARRAFLQQDNELAETRQRLQEQTDHLGDLRMRTKKSSEDVVHRREQLCVQIRTLSVASKALDTARSNLKEADELLSGENGRGRLKNLEHKLRMRKQYMIAQVAQIYPVRPLDEQTPDQKPGFTSNIMKTRNAESVLPNGSQNRPLAILGLQLSKLSVKKTGYFSDKTEFQKSSTALGYASHAVSLIASYLNVPLRYPLRFGGSRSYVLDHTPSAEASSIASVVSSVPSSTSMRTTEFPLFFDGQETTRSAYAVFLLNKVGCLAVWVTGKNLLLSTIDIRWEQPSALCLYSVLDCACILILYKNSLLLPLSLRVLHLISGLNSRRYKRNMASEANNLPSHVKKAVCSSIRLGYQSACDYPLVLGVGILLLFLHKVCPSLLAFLLSSSPVFLLTALLLGALLSCGEPCAPVVREETPENQQALSPESKSSVADSSVEDDEDVAVKVHKEKRSECQVDENVTVKVHAEKRSECQVTYIEDRTSETILLHTECDQENATSVSTSTVPCAESSYFDKNEIIVEREEHDMEICDQVHLQQSESTDAERRRYEVDNQYQFGELMSSCWQPVMRRDPCSDSESDLTESSSDASITDIIPMLDDLNQPLDFVTSHPSSAFRDNLESSSDDNEDDYEEDGNHSSDEDGAEEKKDDGNSWKDFVDQNSLDTGKSGNLDSLMERRKAKNILKFELDRRLMDMQAADAIQKMEEASRFRVQVPSISTPRPKPFDPSNGSEETVELPQIPDSAPSVLLPRRKPFDIPFDQIVDRDSRLQETWTPRLCFPSAQRRKHEDSYVRQSTYVWHHNGTKLEKPENSVKDAGDNHSDSDSEQAQDNGKLFGSLEPHIGDEIKILSAAISDVCVLEVNHGVTEGTENNDVINGSDSLYIQKSISSTSEANDSVSAGSEQSLLCSLSEEYNTEEHIVEAEFISEVNSLFKCRMDEVLVQSISESGIDQPLTGKLEHELNGTLSSGCAMPVLQASSVEELDLQFAQLNGKASACAASGCCCNDEVIQERPGKASRVENGHSSELLFRGGHSSDSPLDETTAQKVDETTAQKVEDKSKELATEGAKPPVLEANSIGEMNSLFMQLEQEVPAHMPHGSEHMFGQHSGETDCGMLLVPVAKSCEDTNATVVHVSSDDDAIRIPGDGKVVLDSDSTKATEVKESFENA
ncbi:hypothetical protein U9M48_034715 [Paspalum notatum var. saurae]|uniref:Uncharacterized protein n=1 Tax=Paspalum notatum var. saurae TaxID=547442 RepID=A0AAQ3X969_PASNO